MSDYTLTESMDPWGPRDTQPALRVLNFGGGVQSTTLLLMMLEGELPRPDVVVFADTGWEGRDTYAHIEWCRERARQGGLELVVLNTGDVRSTKYRRIPVYANVAGESIPLRRQCTAEHKVVPIQRFTRQRLGLAPGQRVPRGVWVDRILGLSADEPQRMKPSRNRWERISWPLIDLGITRWDCYRWLQDHGYAVPPRSSCVGCPYHTAEEWRRIKASPDWQSVVDYEQQINDPVGAMGRLYLHRSMVPIDEIDFDDNQADLDLWGGECEGICGT